MSKKVERLLQEWDDDAHCMPLVRKIAKEKPDCIAAFVVGLFDGYDFDTAKGEAEKLVSLLKKVGGEHGRAKTQGI